MSAGTIDVLQPGFLTTVQDSGRHGFQRLGLPASGAMDSFALRTGNLLVGNSEGDAALEITATGPKLRFQADTRIAITGADMAPRLDGNPMPRWREVAVPEGSVLSFGSPEDGIRCYLCLSGGVDVPLVMGSRSTYLKAALGGMEGRALLAGDLLRFNKIEQALRPVGGPTDPALIPTYGQDHEVRVVLGPQHRAFTSEGIFTFLNSAYTVSADADRTGYRLEGPVIEHVGAAEIISDGSPLGAVQIPGDGRPIILLADRGTTGGYPKIATVISADISTLAQATPGDTIAFKAVTIEDAQAIRREYESTLRALVESAATGRDGGPVTIAIGGQSFDVVDESGQEISRSGAGQTSSATATHLTRVTLDGRTYDFEVEVHSER